MILVPTRYNAGRYYGGGTFTAPSQLSAWSALDGSLNAPGDTGDTRYTFFFNPASIATPVANPLAAYHAGGHPDTRVFDNWLPGGSPSVVSDANYINQPPWKVAGFDYPVGIKPAALPLKDPASGLPSGATISGGNQINMSGNNVVLDGYDLSLGAGGGYSLWITGSGCVVRNCYFKPTNALDPVNGNNTDVQIEYCFIDANGQNTTTAAVVRDVDHLQYIVLINAGQDAYNYGLNFRLAYSILIDSGVNGGHADFYQTGGGAWNQQIQFVTTLQRGSSRPGGWSGGSQGWSVDPNSYPDGATNGFFQYMTLVIMSGAATQKLLVTNNQVVVSPGFNVQYNYLDPTGSLGNNITPFNKGVSPNLGGVTTMNSNVNMTTGNIDNAGEGFLTSP